MRGGKVICPNANRPGAKENVAANRPRLRQMRERYPEAFEEAVRASREQTRNRGSRGGRARGNNGYKKPDFKRMSNDSKAYLIGSILDSESAH